MNPEIDRRRTFAIISHPDAGKTTLTEKFLLFGGQIQVAGAVKNNKIKKTATSDWMDIEKQRGISVYTSVMEFDYTPAHLLKIWTTFVNCSLLEPRLLSTVPLGPLTLTV